MADFDSGLDNLSLVIRDIMWALAPTKRDVRLMGDCLKDLRELVKHLGPDWIVRAFGSVGSGLYHSFSDLDCSCLMSQDANGQLSKGPVDQALSLSTMMALVPHVQEHASFEITEEISRARIPILKMRYQQRLEVDLSFQNKDPFQNTQLLKAYSNMGEIVKQLIQLVKLWAKVEGVCGAPEGHLSSYSFTLMVIYFMQVDPYVQLPVLPTSEFNGDKEIPAAARVAWNCALGLPVLLARFFEFYAKEYSWGFEVISVRKGQRAYASDPAYSQLSICNDWMPHIEDPFLLGRNLNCVLRWEQSGMLQTKLSSAQTSLASRVVPAGFEKALDWCRRSSESLTPEFLMNHIGAEGEASWDSNAIKKNQMQETDGSMAYPHYHQNTDSGKNNGHNGGETHLNDANSLAMRLSPNGSHGVPEAPTPDEVPMTFLCPRITMSL